MLAAEDRYEQALSGGGSAKKKKVSQENSFHTYLI